MTFLNGDGELKTFKTNVLAYEKINSMLASMNYMLNYYLRNYAK